MTIASSRPQTAKKVGPSKLVVGFLAAAMTAVVGLAGVANAAPGGNSSQNVGYGGYGSQTTVNADVKTSINLGNLKVEGNNNVINIVINYIFGGS